MLEATKLLANTITTSEKHLPGRFIIVSPPGILSAPESHKKRGRRHSPAPFFLKNAHV
jgi:hypothetical protein